MTPEQFLNSLTPEERRQFNSLSPEKQRDVLLNLRGGNTPVDAKGVPSQAANTDLITKGAAGVGLHSLLSGMGGGSSVVQASNLASTPAANAAWNSSAMGGEVLPEIASGGTSFFTGNSLLGPGAMGVGDYIPGVAGAIGLYDLSQNREKIGTGEGYLQGAASGAGIGWTLGGPVGAGIGAGVGILGNALGIGGKSRTKIEQDRRAALKEQGIEIPNYDVKEWEENEAFRQSRDEKLLKGGDIENAASFYGIKGYKDLEQAKKEAIAQKAIDLGLIREHHGTIDLNMSDEYQKYLQEQLGAPTPASSDGGDRKQYEADDRRERKRRALREIMPNIEAEVTQAPRYDINPGQLIRNPYL
ncbi:MAG: hypothetical protein BWY21_00355 [Parcubacteria group bacterium ADurb.Bin216]|nr:MAG: hypothetical protein BWY21_00355 [Parcubacteria group bacterium ADurb.Bin216]